MKRPFTRLSIFLLAFCLALGTRAETINVFAAGSLTDTLKEIGATWEKASGHKAVFNFGASSLLARQIEEHAPADVFFSADEPWMERLDKAGRIKSDTRRSRWSNTLVIVTTADSTLTIRSASDLTNSSIKRIALADPKAVPAGVYSKQYLQNSNLWSQVESKVIPTDNVRAALAAVESGNVEVGMVYKTDAAISKKVKIAYEVLLAAGPKIRYPMAVVKDSQKAKVAEEFLKYLESPTAQKIFLKYGFLPVSAEVSQAP